MTHKSNSLNLLLTSAPNFVSDLFFVLSVMLMFVSVLSLKQTLRWLLLSLCLCSECLATQQTTLAQLCGSNQSVGGEVDLGSVFYWPLQQLHQYHRTLLRLTACYDVVGTEHPAFSKPPAVFPFIIWLKFLVTWLCVCLVPPQSTIEYQSLNQGCAQYESLSLSLLKQKKEAETTFLFWKTHCGKATVSVVHEHLSSVQFSSITQAYVSLPKASYTLSRVLSSVVKTWTPTVLEAFTSLLEANSIPPKTRVFITWCKTCKAFLLSAVTGSLTAQIMVKRTTLKCFSVILAFYSKVRKGYM